jgi:AcrR family transcriptional regulator
MGRPARFDTDLLLDVALGLAAAGGPEAVTMAGVAEGAGAPSGSVYHRFADRPALLAALWNRTVGAFQDDLLSALASGGAPAAARHVVAFCRAHPREAAVLLHGAAAFGAADWPSRPRAVAAAREEALTTALRTLATDLGLRGVEGRERVVLAVVDVPYAIARRHLRGAAGGRVPPRAADQAARAAAAILGGDGER